MDRMKQQVWEVNNIPAPPPSVQELTARPVIIREDFSNTHPTLRRKDLPGFPSKHTPVVIDQTTNEEIHRQDEGWIRSGFISPDDHRIEMVWKPHVRIRHLVQMVWDCSVQLNQRFRGGAPEPGIQRKAFKEEVNELLTASSLGGSGEMIEEAYDVMVTLFGLLQAHDIEWEDLLDQIALGNAKNDAKTHETHVLDPETGKILKRGKKARSEWFDKDTTRLN